MRIKVFILVGLVLGFWAANFAQAQKIQKCLVPKETDGKYKLITESRPLKTFKEVLLQIVIKPTNFNNDYMTEFAKQIKATYCNDYIISVDIFDSKKSSLGWHYDYVITGGKVDRRRGTYFFNRKTGEEGVEYSTKSGNPVNEIRIELSKSKQDEK